MSLDLSHEYFQLQYLQQRNFFFVFESQLYALTDLLVEFIRDDDFLYDVLLILQFFILHQYLLLKILYLMMLMMNFLIKLILQNL